MRNEITLESTVTTDPLWGEALRAVLDRLGISTNRFAGMVGISQPCMRAIVQGRNRPRSETAERIGAALSNVDACGECGRAKNT